MTVFGRALKVRRGVLAVMLALVGGPLQALTMKELLADTAMTPKRFAKYFADFAFDEHPMLEVINPDQFLSERAGDCIDYAVLADYVLKRKGYGTRLIRVEMVGTNSGHAICYVTDDRVYLDYNNRSYLLPLTRSGPTLREIASKVADSFEANWTFAQEFTFGAYDTYIKRAIMTVVKTDPPASDPDRNPRPTDKSKTKV